MEDEKAIRGVNHTLARHLGSPTLKRRIRFNIQENIPNPQPLCSLSFLLLENPESPPPSFPSLASVNNPCASVFFRG